MAVELIVRWIHPQLRIAPCFSQPANRWTTRCRRPYRLWTRCGRGLHREQRFVRSPRGGRARCSHPSSAPQPLSILRSTPVDSLSITFFYATQTRPPCMRHVSARSRPAGPEISTADRSDRCHRARTKPRCTPPPPYTLQRGTLAHRGAGVLSRHHSDCRRHVNPLRN